MESSNWERLTLGDVTKWSSGGTPSKSEQSYWNGDIPWISASSMDGHLYSDSKLKITQSGLDNGSRLAPENSILLLVRGSILHQKIQVGLTTRPVAFNQDVKCLQANEKYIDSWFLLLWFLSKEKELLNIVESTGIGAGKFDTKLLMEYPIDIPSFSERKKITSFGKMILDKITLNRQINQTLEQMAQTLFKSWFVDFDPVIDNALDAGNEIPEVLQNRAELRQKVRASQDFQPLPADVRALFPAEFEESELGWVPKGWVIGEIATFGKVITGKTPPASENNAFSDDEKLVPFITPTDISLDTHVISTARYLTLRGQECLSKSKIPKGSINVTCIGSQMGKAIISVFDAYTNQQINSIIPEVEFLRNYLFLNLRNRREELLLLASSGSTMPILNKSDFSKINVLIPDDACAKAFDTTVSGFLSKIEHNLFEINNLSKIRDTLLPKLISGELRLDDLPDEVVTAANE